MKKFFLTLFFITIFFSLPIVASAFVGVEITVKDNFYVGEIMSFDYFFVSTQNELLKYLPQIICDNMPSSPLETKSATLKAGQAFYDSYSFGRLDQSFTASNCQAQISIMEPEQLVKYKPFNVTMDEHFDFSLNICPSADCYQYTKVFARGETIYLNYISDIANPIVTVILVNPLGNETKLTLPTNFVAEEIGTYTITASAEKVGYHSVNAEEQIGVVRSHMDLPQVVIKKSSVVWKIVGWASLILLILLLVFLTYKYFSKYKK